MKIISFNIWGIYGPKLAERWEFASQKIAELAPDILCLQEGTDRSLLDNLAKTTGLTMQLSDPDETGLCLLSKTQAIKVKLIPYTFRSPVENYTRKVIVAQYEYNSIPFTITNTHLSWKPEDDQTRSQQAQALHELIVAADKPAIACGDFNCEYSSSPLTVLRDNHYGDSLVGQPDENKPSWDNVNPFIQSHHTKFPNRRVDLVLLRNHANHQWKLESSRIVLNKPNHNGLYPSDHYGIECIIDF
ncbi:MAG: endonuclease/exonuclease/phosphatase family metal-dependent hydrolase [Candidatus Omnitrophota bacterium]|jgi:endonuclease/exonuclease/phosphatase family metal-dependent hydrolase